MGFNDQLDMSRCYYVATADRQPMLKPLGEDISVDLVVVGAGCTGLSAAVHAAERGLKVVVVEGGRVGWGASGRNGGQIIPGLRKGALELVRLYGVERARALFHLSLEARTLVGNLIQRHAISCALAQSGHLTVAAKARDAEHLQAEAQCLGAVMGYRDVSLLDKAQVRAAVDAPYVAGLLDHRGGHFHTLNYTLGLARAAQAAGVKIYEHSPALDLAQGQGVRVRTARGVVRADHAILAGDALMTGLAPQIDRRIMPVGSYVVATEPLADPSALIPHNAAVSDMRFAVNYFRMTPDGRLLFGGGERYTPRPPRDIAAFVRPNLERIFPRLRGVAIDYAWGGMVSVTTSRLPHLGRQGQVYFAHGYSGMGAILSTLAGKLMVEAIGGEASRFERFAAVEPLAFPGGVALRDPLYVLGMFWYALMDRL